MSDFYDDLASTGQELIDEFGRDVIYRAFDQGIYDPLIGETMSASTSDTTVRAVMSDVKMLKIDTEITQRGDKIVLIAAGDIVPNLKDFIIDGTAVFKVIAMEEIKPGDTPVLYKLQVRK